MRKKQPDRSAASLRRDAEFLRAAADKLPSGHQRAVLLYGALYAEASADRREALEGALTAAADEVVSRFTLH